MCWCPFKSDGEVVVDFFNKSRQNYVNCKLVDLFDLGCGFAENKKDVQIEVFLFTVTNCKVTAAEARPSLKLYAKETIIYTIHRLSLPSSW